jgi:DNA-binding CsgD family transcriptional regulator
MRSSKVLRRESAAPFVGRREELEFLQSAWAAAVAEGPVAVLIVGEAGIGKTRLAQEFTAPIARGRSRMGAVWVGRAGASGRGPAFSALFHALGHALAGLSPDERRTLADQYPHLSAWFPDLRGGVASPPAHLSWDRLRLFKTLRRFVTDLLSARPAVLWIDDLPDADAETLAWLQYFFRHTERCPLLFLGTCRMPDREMPPPAYDELEALLLRQGQLDRLTLGPLPDEASDRLVAHVLKATPAEDVLTVVRQRAAGVPLYILELLRLVSEAPRGGDGPTGMADVLRQAVPPTLATLMGQRLAGVSDLERRALGLVAASDGPLPWTVLRAAAESVRETALARALARLVRMGVLEETHSARDVAYDVSHPLLRSAIVQRMPDLDVRQAHKALAYAWGGDVVRAAYHAGLAGRLVDARTAFTTLSRAGRHYLDLHAYPSAAACLEEAWAVAEDPSASVSDEERMALQLALAEVYTYSGRKAEAFELLHALDLACSAVTWKIRIKRLLCWIAHREWPERSTRYADEGIRHWDGVTENEDVGWLMMQRVDNATNVGDIAAARRALASLSDYAAQCPTDRNTLRLQVRELVVRDLDWRNEPWRAVDHDHGLERANRTGDPEAMYDVCCAFGYHALRMGDFRRALDHASRSVPLLRRFGMVHHELSIRLMGFCALFQAGRWAEAEREAEAVSRLASDHDAGLALLCAVDGLGTLYALQGKWEACRSALERANALAVELFGHPLARTPREMAAAEAIRRLFQGTPWTEAPASVVWANTHGLPGFLALIEGMLAVRAGAPEEAERLVETLRRAAGQHEPNYLEGVADFLKGLVAKEAGRIPHALAAMGHAAEIFRRVGTPFEWALAQLEWADMARYRYPRQAIRAAQSSREAFQRLGAVPLATRAEGLAATSDEGDGTALALSEREWDVARGVARGLSNKAIAEALHVSPRTVSTHLDHIYKKLGVHSRTALIARLHQGPPRGDARTPPNEDT